MKAFYSAVDDHLVETTSATAYTSLARVAVYDDLSSAPRVEEVSFRDPRDFIESIASRVYEAVRSIGGSIPYTVLREVTENFIHADFAEPVVTVMDAGSTVRFADQGPGISDKSKALQPGFTSATTQMKRFIRGVGSGLPIVAEYLSLHGGSLTIDDNMGHGCVVTLSSRPKVSESTSVSHGTLAERAVQLPSNAPLSLSLDDISSTAPVLSNRQKQVLALVLESGTAGPSLVSKELGVGLSTAYRDLASLEDLGLIEADGGKRRLTTDGISYLSTLMNSQ